MRITKEPEWSETFQEILDETLEELKKEYPLNIKQIEKANIGFNVTGLIILAINIYRRKVVENMKNKGIKLTLKDNFNMMNAGYPHKVKVHLRGKERS